MAKQNVILILVLALFIIVSGFKGKDKAEVTAEDVKQNVTNIAEKKNHNNIQKPEKTNNARESPSFNLCSEDFTYVSMIQLIANPEKFDGKHVFIVGFVQLEFEGDAIFLHEDDYKNGLTRNGLWLSLTEDCCGKDIREFDQKYVLVGGTFSAKNRGHMSLFSGAIENIKRFQVWIVKRGPREK